MRFTLTPSSATLAAVASAAILSTSNTHALPTTHSLTFQALPSPWYYPFSSLVSSLGCLLHHHQPAISDAPSAPHFVVYGYSDNESPIGVPDPSNIQGFNVYNVAFYTSRYAATGALQKWTQASQDDRNNLKQKYVDNGIKLIVSVGGEGDPMQSDGNDPKEYAKKVAKFAKKYSFDGVDLDYEEFDIFGQDRVVDWLVDFTNTLRDQLGPDAIITHAPVAPWFSQQNYPGASYVQVDDRAGTAINWYNIQYYNQGDQSYTHCNSLLWNGTPAGWPSTSIFEINKFGGIALEKLLIGKPGSPDKATNGYMDFKTLGGCVQQGVSNGWNGGVMFWEYPAMTAAKLGTLRDAAGI